MAFAPMLTEAERESIAAQIGELLPTADTTIPAFVGDEPFELAESLPVVMLPLDRLKTTDGTLGEAIRSTGRWHHQVAGPGGLTSAKSLVRGGEHEVVEVAASTVPASLAETIDWVDANLPGDQIASLLVVPSYYLTAIMLRGDDGDQVVVSQRPARLKRLIPNQVLGGRAFIETLREYPPSADLLTNEG